MQGSPDKQIVHNSCAGLDSRDPALLDWIATSGVAAIVADNLAVEDDPPRPGGAGTPFLPLHELCLFKLGINLGEMWVPHRARGLAARTRTHAVFPQRAAAALARSRRLARHPDRDRVTFAAAGRLVRATYAKWNHHDDVNLPWTAGSAASVSVVLLWLSYSSYLFLPGAEFTQVYRRERTRASESPPA